MPAVRHVDNTYIRVVTHIEPLLNACGVGQSVVVEHHTMSCRKAPMRQGIGELQIDIMVENAPAPVCSFLPGHLVIPFHACHQIQPLHRQRCIQFQYKHRQLVRMHLITGILIPA